MTARGRTPPEAVARGADVLARDYMAVRSGEAVLITGDTATDTYVPPALAGAVAGSTVWTRRADRPGLHFVPGACTMFPDPDSVRGELHVVAAFHEHFARFAEPAVLTIDGHIRRVSGGGGGPRARRRAAVREAAARR